MVNFNDESTLLLDAFKLTDKDMSIIEEVSTSIANKSHPPTTWVLRRIWIDERLSDNAKCYMIFMTGRFYELNNPII